MLGGIGSALMVLGVSLALFGGVLWLVKRLTGTSIVGRGAFPLEVLGRIAVGPRQGVTALRVGRRVVLVSVGEGGVRPLLELPETEWSDAVEEAHGVAAGAAHEFRARLLRSLRVSASIVGVLLLASGVAPTEAVAGEWAAVATGAMLQVAPGAPAQAAAVTQQGGRALPPGFVGLPRVDLQIGEDDSGLRLSGTVGAVVVMGLLTILPTLLLLMTSFTRILIVLHLVRQALGTQTTPPSHLVSALALLLTGFVMAPTLAEVNRTALAPWMEGAITEGEMLQAAAVPFRAFMLEHTREQDLVTFLELGDGPPPASAEEIPLTTLASAFVTSELRAAFQMGFVLFLPFIVIDIVVASVLMSLGMFMLPPVMISLPCKLLLFVLVDGWTLVVQSLA